MNSCILIQSPRTVFCLRNSFPLRYAHLDWAEVVWWVSGLLEAGLGSAPTCWLPAEDRRAPSPPLASMRAKESRGRKENKLSSFTRRTQTPVYPCSTCSLISLKDLIHLCVGTVPHTQLCTSKPLHFQPLYLNSSVCAPFFFFLPNFLDGHPKEKCRRKIHVALLDLSEWYNFWGL